jgi:hypothetical protein
MLHSNRLRVIRRAAANAIRSTFGSSQATASRGIAAVERLEGRQLLSSYYIDPTIQGARDTTVDGWGQSSAQPFATVAAVKLLDLEGGDQVLLRSIDSAGAAITHSGRLELDANDSGTEPAEGVAANPVVIGSYVLDQLGNPIVDSAPRAILQGVLDASGNDSTIVGTNVGAIEIGNLSLRGATAAGATEAAHFADGITFENDTNAKDDGVETRQFKYLRFHDLDVSGFSGFGITIGGKKFNGADYATYGKAGFDNVVISRVEAFNNATGGIETHGNFYATAGLSFANHDVTIDHCYVHDNLGYANSSNHVGDGIMVSDVQVAAIERNVASFNGAKNTHVGGPVGIWAWDADQITIQYNESHHNKTSSTADGGGFDLDGGVTNSLVQYNYSHDNDGAGYGIYQFQGARAFYKNTFRYNISQNDARKNGYGAIDFWNGNGTNGIKDIEVHNNTIYVSPVNGVLNSNTDRNPKPIRFISGTTDVRVRNNIFIATSGLWVADVQAKQTRLLFQGNSYHATGTDPSTGKAAAFKLKWFAKVYPDLASLRKSTGQEMVGSIAVGSSLNPNLPNAGTAGNIVNIDKMAEELTAYRPTGKPAATGGTTTNSRGGAINLWSALNFDPGRKDFYGNLLPATQAEAATFSYDAGAAQYVLPNPVV